MTETHYQRWFEDSIVNRFSKKSPPDFFMSEKYFVEKIIGTIASVLDIGCASGKYIEFLDIYKKNISYTGIDLVEEGIEQARLTYPNHKFIYGNAISVDINNTFDLVNAIGVFQHEPNYSKLLDRMIEKSNRYVLFDLKLANVNEPIVDLDVAFSGKGKKTYFILLNFELFMDELTSIPGIQKIEVHGYRTATNRDTTIPFFIETVVSATFLISLGQPIESAPIVVNQLDDDSKRLLQLDV